MHAWIEQSTFVLRVSCKSSLGHAASLVATVIGKGKSYGQAGTQTHNLPLTRRMIYQLSYWTDRSHRPLHFSIVFLEISYPKAVLLLTTMGYLVRRQFLHVREKAMVRLGLKPTTFRFQGGYSTNWVIGLTWLIHSTRFHCMRSAQGT